MFTCTFKHFHVNFSPTVHGLHVHLTRPVRINKASKHQFPLTVSATVNQIEDRRYDTFYRSPRHVLPLAPPRSTTRSATFNRTLRHVQPHATSRSTPRYVIRVNFTFAHDSSLPFTHQFRSPILLSCAHRFCSVPLTDSAHLRSRTLTYPATNTHASNEHSRPLNEHYSLQPQVPHSTRSCRKHNLLSFSLGFV